MSSIQDSDLHGLDLTVFNNGQDPYPASDDTLKKTFIHPVQYYTDVVNKVGVPEHGRVLDLLCGVGRWSVFLAQSCSELVGIDRLTGCTNIAAGLCKHLGLTNTQFFDRDVSYVENFSDASFDVVWMYSALQYVDRAYTLRQAQRLLKPGGLLVVRNYNAIGLMVNHMLTGVLAGDTDQGSTRWAMNALAKGEQDDGSPNYVTTSGAPKLLHRFGFRLENVSVAEEFFTEAADFSSGVGNDTAHDGALAAACSKLANQFDPVVNFVAVKKDAAETVFDADSYLAEVAAGTLSHADVSELARLDPESAIRQLLGKLSSQDQLEQQNARAILVGLEEIAFQPLVDAAVKSDGTVKINAKNALLELAERNSGAIVRMLMQADEKTREFVLDLGNQHIMETAGKTNQDRIKVVVVLSLAYSGSTWTTLTVGSQRDAICLGGGDQIFDAAEGRYQYQCQLHGPSCRYWSENFKDYQNGDNLFLHLAATTGKRVFVINNPSMQAVENHFKHPAIDLYPIHLIRDGRAALASAMKHHPDRVDSVYQSSIAWLYRGTRNLKNKIEKFGRPALVVRYEDLVEQTVSTLHRIGNFVGIPFNGEEMKYWLAEHHLLAGNSGTIETLIRLQDGEEKTGSGEDDYYDRLVRQLVNSGGRPILDDSWKQRYSEEELAAYEYSNGTVYGAFGYPASEYSEQARRNFYQSFNPPESVDEAAKSVGPWRRDSARNEEQPTPLLRRVFASIRYRISKIG